MYTVISYAQNLLLHNILTFFSPCLFLSSLAQLTVDLALKQWIISVRTSSQCTCITINRLKRRRCYYGHLFYQTTTNSNLITDDPALLNVSYFLFPHRVHHIITIIFSLLINIYYFKPKIILCCAVCVYIYYLMWLKRSKTNYIDFIEHFIIIPPCINICVCKQTHTILLI